MDPATRKAKHRRRSRSRSLSTRSSVLLNKGPGNVSTKEAGNVKALRRRTSCRPLTLTEPTAARVDDPRNNACLVDSARYLASWNDNARHSPLSCLFDPEPCPSYTKAVRPLQDVLSALSRKRGRRRTGTLKRSPRTARDSTLHGQPSPQKRTRKKRGKAASRRRKQTFSMAVGGKLWPKAMLASVYAVFPPVSDGANVLLTRKTKRSSKGLQDQCLPQIVPKSRRQRRRTKRRSKKSKVKGADGKDRSRIKCPPLRPQVTAEEEEAEEEKTEEEEKFIALSPSPSSQWLAWKRKNRTEPLPYAIDGWPVKTTSSLKKGPVPSKRSTTRLPAIPRL